MDLWTANLSSFARDLISFLFYTFQLPFWGLPWWLSRKESTCNAGDMGVAGLTLGLGSFPGGGNGNPLQYSFLEIFDKSRTKTYNKCNEKFTGWVSQQIEEGRTGSQWNWISIKNIQSGKDWGEMNTTLAAYQTMWLESKKRKNMW